MFGIKVEQEYQAAIAAAQRAAYGRDVSWYFLHLLHKQPATRPWVAVADGLTRPFAIAATVNDLWWQSLDSSGLETGLRGLDEVGRRGRTTLGDSVVWSTSPELTARTLVGACG